MAGGAGGNGGVRTPLLNGSSHAIPGLTPQSPNTMKFSEDEKGANRAGEPQISATGVKSFHSNTTRNGDSHINGDGPFVNGNHTSDLSAMSSKIHQDPQTTEEIPRQAPPEIQHISSGYVSLSALIERLVQESFNDLGNVINDMAEMPAEPRQSNGVVHHNHHQSNGIVPGKSEANVQKKLLMLNFTQNWRPKFIKILVLSQWARQAESVSRVIDLKNWEDTERMEYDGAVTAMGELKRGLVALKDPSPDIKTALEVLLLGKASWLPDFDYLSPEPLSTQQLLDAFRRINTVLSIRLNLHEKIPTELNEFSISSGRATFRVPQEFEVDLSVAEEDPSSQLFFVDFRMIFSPSTSALPPGFLRTELEERANEALEQDGLQGLFDFLHNLVLTHKLNVLKNQAFEMAKGYWSEHLVVEPVRRSVIVQYWSNRPGGKNWVEIGVRRGEEKSLANAEIRETKSRIGMRCFRAGKEVNGIEVDLRLGDISLESILKQVIARHTSEIYDGIANKLLDGLLYATGCLKVESRPSDLEPTEASLFLQLAAATAIKIVQEPISGRFAVQPASQLNGRAEYELNRLDSPSKEAASQLAYLRSLVSVDELEASAREIGWELLRSITPSKEEMLKHFPTGTLQTRFFRRKEWSATWILVFTTSLEGDSWWVVELVDRRSKPEEPKPQATPRFIKAAYSVCSKEKRSLVFSSSNQALTQIEWTAVGMISQYNDTRALSDELRHTILPPGPGVPALMMSIHIPKSMLSSAKRQAVSQKPHKKFDITEPHETLRLLYKGVDAVTHSAVHIAVARVNKSIARLGDIVSKIPNLDVVQVPIGTAAIGHPQVQVNVFKFMLVNKVGESCIPSLISRLVSIERLIDYVSVLESNSLFINSSSLSQLKFTYSPSPRILKATVDFSMDGRVLLSFPPRSPHLRIRDFLTGWLSKAGLVPVIALLRLTLPILNAFTAIEKSHSTNDVSIIARSEQWFEVRYAAPLSKGGYDITLRLRREVPYWFIKESSIKKTEPVQDEEAWMESLRAVTRGRGKGWRGMKGGIVAQTADGVGEALSNLDEVFRKAVAVVSEEKKPTKRKAESQVVEID